MSDITLRWLYIFGLVFGVVMFTVMRYGFERLFSTDFKSISAVPSGSRLLVRAILLILFNLAILLVFDVFDNTVMPHTSVFSFPKPGIGLVILAVGAGVAILAALMSMLAIRAGYGEGYRSMVSASNLDKALTLVTFLLLAGPSEDIFFLGFAQGILTTIFGWGAIIGYLVIFVGYHYANVLSGVETRHEFLGALPVRLIVASLLGVSFYLTGSLLWGMIVHNLVDTLSYVVLLIPGLQPKSPALAGGR